MAEPIDPLIEKLAEFAAEREAKAQPHLIGIPPADDLFFCEPCAGDGSFLRLMPPERRVGFDILPADNGELGIIQADYQTRLLAEDRSWIILTNPPFSKGGPLRLFQWAAGQPCVCAIGLIVPRYFEHPTTVNKLHRAFHLA